MMPAAKHGDPQAGIDIHLCIVPPGQPTPLPTPHTSIVFDPFDYVPILGATVTVCGMKRATAGTNAKVIHIPPGFPFAPLLPESDDELFMGSSTVVADGDPMSHVSHPVLGCHVAGMISPPRLKKKNTNFRNLPTTFNLAIPTSVFIGGPPTISLMGMAFKGLFAALGKFAKSGLFKRMRQRLFGKLKPGFLKCAILRAEPVNILSGEVSFEQEDFTLPGRIPIVWRRTYSSGTHHAGWCGNGWETPADIRLEVESASGSITMFHPTDGPLFFEHLPVVEGSEAAELELMDGALLTDHGDEYRVQTKEDRIYHFAKALRVNVLGVIEYPISRISDLCGNWLEYQRRGAKLVGINESAGRRIELVSKDGRISEIALYLPGTEIRHAFVRYQYDVAGDLVSVIDALDQPYTFAYESHRMVRHTDRNGLSFYYQYDQSAEGDWRVIHAWGDGGLYDYKFEYFDPLNERRITDSLRHTSTVKLNEAGFPISEIDPLGGMTIFEYDERGRASAVVDQDGNRTGYEYDECGNLLKLTRPDGVSIQTEFNSANKATKITDPNGAQWQQEWDSRGLLTSQVSPLGAQSRYEYNTYGQLVGFNNPKDAHTTLAFDTYGNLTRLHDALGHATVFDYDLLGSVNAKGDPLAQRTTYDYDLKGRLRTATLPSGATIACAYDHEDNLTCYVDENGAETRLDYFGQGEIKRRIQPDGHVVEYHYDTEERLIGVTNQRGETYQLKRDALGRIVEEVDYWGQSRRYAYEASGYLKASADPLGRVINYAADPLGRILKKTLPDGMVENFAYDANGNLTETSNQQGKVQREFDAEGRLIEEVQGSFSIKNSYDANGNRIVRKTSLDNAVAYDYDPLDQVVAVQINKNEPIQIGRDAVGRVAHEQLSPQLSRRFNYSADGYLTEQAVTVNESPLFATRFDYDKAGNLTQRSDSQFGIDQYRYDPIGRITEHLDPQNRLTRYFNDPAGDRLRTRIVEGTHQSVVGGDVVEGEWSREGEYQGIYYRFDRAGNLVERRDGQRDLHLLWDANQRLVESHANGVVTHYGYDPLGRRLFKETGDRRTLFYWDGDALLGEAVVSLKQSEPSESGIEGNVVDLAERREQAQAATKQKAREFVYYPETFEPLALLDGVGDAQQVYHYHNDPNGCPTRLTDVNGEVKWGASYTAWGGIAQLHVSEVDNPIRLQGQYEDGETGLHYNRFRYFETISGQFVSQDPLRLNSGEHIYSYATCILKWVDPLGLNCSRFAGDPSALHRAIREQWGHAMSGAEMREINDTINRIRRRNPLFPQDMTSFRNDWRMGPNQQRLHTGTAYTEWVVRTPGVGGAGQRRIVVDNNTGRAYYTHDHYDSYVEVGMDGW